MGGVSFRLGSRAKNGQHKVYYLLCIIRLRRSFRNDSNILMKNILKLNAKKRLAPLKSFKYLFRKKNKPKKLCIREHDLVVGISLYSKLVNEGVTCGGQKFSKSCQRSLWMPPNGGSRDQFMDW